MRKLHGTSDTTTARSGGGVRVMQDENEVKAQGEDEECKAVDEYGVRERPRDPEPGEGARTHRSQR